MVRNILKYLILLFIAVFSSCNRLSDSSTIISGNQKFRSGNYQEAIIDYLKGVDSEINKDYFYYNLGNVYSSLGEYPSAFAVWNMADGKENYALQFNLLFNRGVLEFQEGNYNESYTLFKQALFLMPSSIRAKVNLELSLNKMSVATHHQNSENSPSSSEPSGVSDETVRILEYVKQKEVMKWGSKDQEQQLENDW